MGEFSEMAQDVVAELAAADSVTVTLKHATARSFSTSTGIQTPTFTDYTALSAIRGATYFEEFGQTKARSERRDYTLAIGADSGQVPSALVIDQEDRVVDGTKTYKVLTANRAAVDGAWKLRCQRIA